MTPVDLAGDVTAARDHSGGAWFTLGVLFIGQMLVVGGIAYGFGLLVKPLAEEYGLSRADVNIGLMVLIVGMAFFSPVIGYALDRLPGRFIVTGGAALFAMGCLAVIAAPSLGFMVVAAFCLVAFGGAALGPLAGSTLVARSFEAGRGRALGIVSVSASVGGLLVLPAMAVLVTAHGWRGAVGAVGLTVLLVAGGLGWFVDTPPARGRSFDSKTGKFTPSWTAVRIVRTADFWLIALAVGLMMAVDQALLASLVSYGTDRGFSVAAATMIVSVISGMAIVGKLVIGALSDRIDGRWLFLLIVALNGGFLALLTTNPPYGLLFASAIVFGLGFGGTMPLWASFIANRFGTAAFGTVMGLMVPLQMPLNIIGLRYVGHVYDANKNYGPAFGMFVGIILFAALAILPVRRR